LIVLQPAKRERARAVDPGIVVFVHYDSSSAGRGIERHHPSVFVVRCAGHQYRFGSVFGPDRLRELNIAFARFIGARALTASVSLRAMTRAVAVATCLVGWR